MARKLSKAQQQERQEAITRLREVLKPGDTVYTIVRRVARSGMSRVITPLIIRPDGSRFYLGRLVALACDWPIADRDQGLRVGGCGMDMCFQLVYVLAATIFQDSPNSDAPSEREAHPGRRGYWLRKEDL